MADVHNRILRASASAIERLLDEEIDVAALLERARLVEYLDSGERVPWARFAAFLSEVREHAGGEQGMIELGRRSNMRGNRVEDHPLRELVRGVISAQRLYRTSFRIQHRTGYPFMNMSFAQPRPREVHLSIRIPEPYVGCVALFEAITGQLETLPTLLGQPRAEVEARYDARGAQWRIIVPQRQRAWTRLWEALTQRVRQRRIRADVELELDALERQHARLAAAFTELERQSVALREEVEARERLERERHELERALLHNQRLELVGQLTGGIAHDFNNLLHVIAASGELLEHELSREHPGREHVEEIHEAVTSARGLTRQLLGFSREEGDVPARVELLGALAGLLKLLRRVLPRDISLLSRTPAQSEPLWVELRPVELQQLLLNLVVNARDAMREGGAIELDVRRVGDAVVIEVRDQGVGMDAVTRARIFEPFFTTKPEGEGTGLGMAIVSGLLERCGGEIEVESAPGEGTCMRLRLPLLDPPA